jgi:hypothetical protein
VTARCRKQRSVLPRKNLSQPPTNPSQHLQHLRKTMSAQHLSPPQAAQLSKRGSLTPSIVRLLNRYPPAILEDTPSVPETEPRPQQSAPEPLTPFDRRFPQGYKVADSSIPLHPDEVPVGYEDIFSPSYNPICRRVGELRIGADCSAFYGDCCFLHCGLSGRVYCCIDGLG